MSLGDGKKRSTSVVLLALVLLWMLGLIEGPGPRSVSEQELAARDKEQLTAAWQTDHCPPEAQKNLAEITLGDGTIADVDILDLPDGRIYLPRAWTNSTRHSRGPSPDGFAARTGGSGTFEPWLGPGATEPCRGHAYASVPGKESGDPRFQLGIVFPRFSTRSSTGVMEERPGLLPYVHQIIELVFFGPEEGDPDNLPLLRLGEGGESRSLGDGWEVTQRDGAGAFKRVAFETGEGRAGTSAPPAKAVEVLEGWSLVFPVQERVRAMVVVDHQVPVARWRSYRVRAEELYRWLRTKPADRLATPGEL